jgi:eukaryotic-like serine/threonine-protein kinase
MDKTLLNGRYRLDDAVGQGGMGVVYRGHDLLLERDVAVKVLNRSALGTEGRARLLREAQAVARLNHPNIVTLYDAGEAEGAPFIVMELLPGVSLYDHKPANLDELVEIAQQVCSALDHAHRHGIVHRDLKPENVIVVGQQDADRPADAADADEPPALLVKLTDFGLARSTASRVTTDGGVVGTVYYLPPEQALGQELDGRADLYALGIMLYELAAGRLPFGGNDPLTIISQHLHAPVVPPSTYNPQISRPLEALILKLMNKRREDRPTSAAEVGRVLERIARKSTDLILSTAVVPELSPLDRLVRGRLVGRDRELADAKVVWHRATVEPDAQSEHVLLVSGDAGVGKTPFVRAIRALAEVSRGRVLHAECYAEGSAPYAPVTQLISEFLTEDVRLGLPDLILGDLIKVSPELHARYPELRESPSLTPEAEQQRLYDSVVAACAALIEGQWTGQPGAPAARTKPANGAQNPASPLLIVVEDVHWADSSTLSLIRHLARRSRTHCLKLLIVLTYRESELDAAQPLSKVLLDLTRERLAQRIRLNPFTLEQTTELLQVMFQQEVSDSFAADIYRETEGNLFYIEEVCKALIEDNGIYCTADDTVCWHFPSDMTRVRLPQSVRLAVQARIDKLSPERQEVLRLAAIIGREFDFATLQAASDADEDRLIDALEAAQRGQLVIEVSAAGNRETGSERFRFEHNLTLTTLRGNVSGLRRRRLHRRVAEAIRSLRPDDDAALAYHFDAAGDAMEAQRHYRRAGDRARRVYANDDATAAYSAALALMPEVTAERFDVLLARAQTHDLVARRSEQRADVEELLALADRLNDPARRCDALMAQADYYMKMENLRARGPAQQAAELAAQLDDKAREGRALRLLGFDARTRMDLQRSRTMLEASAQRFRECGQMHEAAATLHTLSLTLSDLNEYKAALAAAQEAVALSRQAGDKRQEATSLRRIAIVYLEQSQFTAALSYAEAALALHRAVGDRVEESHALNVIGISHAWLGDAVKAEAYLRAALNLAETATSAFAAMMAAENLSFFHYSWRGDYAGAIAFLDEMLVKPCLETNEYALNKLRLRRADFLSRLGQYKEAMEHVQTVLGRMDAAIVQGVMDNATELEVLTFLGWLNAALGDREAAFQYLERAHAGVDQAEAEFVAATVEGLFAHALLMLGELDDIRRALPLAERALTLYGDNPSIPVERTEARRIAAEIHLALGAPETALGLMTQAMDIIGATPFMPERNFYTAARILKALGRTEEAEEHLRHAYQRVLLIAGSISDAVLQRSWLESVKVNREIVAEWEAVNARSLS